MVNYKRFVRSYRGIIISLVIIIGVIIGAIAGLVPVIQKIFALQSETASLSSDVSLLRTKLNYLDQLDEPTLKSYLVELAAAVPPDKSLSSLFGTIDGLSARTGVAVSEFTVLSAGSIASEAAKQQTQEEKKIGSNLLPFTVKVMGGYDQIRNFLDQSVGVRRFFRVRNFDISFADVTSISVRMGMDAFYLPFPTNLGSVQEQLQPLTEEEQNLITKVANLPLLGQTVSVTSGMQPSVSSKADPFSP
ncbi:hypothetical protein A2Z00_03535 [Candidatus Gottesmanbacteria bacterium RBG_13_45_10]|uniref:Pilus assembly protein PilO n=1 Tax=Candidatus Gottesmanbacteria bacterium RBG_13_45_10 TaxID=1798370 RepID=A0A1F5ZH97_9BACT|nr:MAG: hypothetical protein A2Z00_03535 [Candidatus Gottesmanbacteria bacterium RBG_13_45_10]